MIQELTTPQRPDEIFQGRYDPSHRHFLSPLSLKTKQIALGFFSGLFFLTALVSLATLSTGIITAIPAAAGGALCIWLISRVKAYEDPVALKQYRKDALHQSLTKTVQEHGWRNMNLYKIPSQDAFQRLFLETVEGMTIKEAVSFWQKASQAQEGVEEPYVIPGPHVLQDKWRTETQGMEVTEVLATYNVGKYIKLDFAHPKLNEAIRLYEDVLQQLSAKLLTTTEFDQQCSAINRQYKVYLTEEIPVSDSN